MILVFAFLLLTQTRFMKNLILLLLIALLFSASLFCKKESDDNNNVEPPGSVELRDSVIASNLNYPWEILWGPDNQIWMTERGGRISRLNPATGAVSPLFTISEVEATGEGGLLGMALHPDFLTTPHVFVVYNYDGGSGYREKVVRYTYEGTTLTNPSVIIDNIAAAGIHNGSRIVISSDLRLFISTGDAANPAIVSNRILSEWKDLKIKSRRNNSR